MLIWQLVLVQIATFVLIILFLHRLLYSHISRALGRLRQLNQQNLEREKALKEKMERAKKQAESEIEQGKIQAESIRKQAREEAEKVRKGLLELSSREAKRIVSEGVRDSQRKNKDLILQMQDKALYLAMDIIKYIFTERILQSLHAQIIDELIESIAELEKEKIKAQSDRAEIVCAYSLEKDQKRRLQQALSSKLGRNIILKEKVDQEIVAGLIIRLAGFVVIDGSVKNKFKRILPLMKEKARAEVV